MGRLERTCKQLVYGLKEKRTYWKLRGNTRSHCLVNYIWNRLWICHQLRDDGGDDDDDDDDMSKINIRKIE